MISLVDALIVLLAIAAIALCVVIWREDKQWEAHREELYEICKALFPDERVFEEAYREGDLDVMRVIELIKADPWLTDAIAEHNYYLEIAIDAYTGVATEVARIQGFKARLREEIEQESEDARGENRQCNPMSSTEEEL